MKKVLWLFAMTNILFPLKSILSQTLSDYISEVKGDTLVIKDYYEMNNQPSSLYNAITLDTSNVPEGRVYELKSNGYYPLGKNPTTLRKTVIVGEDNTILVNNKNADMRLPLICGSASEGGLPFPNNAGIYVAHDLIVRNCNIILFSSEGGFSYSFIYPVNENLKMIFDNCLVEHLLKDFLFISKPGYSVTLRNCYLVNMNAYPCRRSGGVLDCFANLDTLLVENCTHLMSQGSLYRLRPGYHFKKIIFNHNTFVNCAGYTFMNPGFHDNVSLTNNIFVNCNIQPYSHFIFTHDIGEVDPDNIPMGLVNVYPDSEDVANNTSRKFLCQDNLAYWDPSVADIDSTLNANAIDGITNWQSQRIIMNARTDSMFAHEGSYGTTPYSYLVTDTWKNRFPTFTDSKDLFTTQLANLKSFALSTVDSTGGWINVLPTWRLVNTSSDDYLKSDWPIPIDLSYSDADLLTAGIGGFPIGDLNWFPAKKAEWQAQMTNEYNNIDSALNSGKLVTDIQDRVNLPVEFQLFQNYPNPFNLETAIRYKLQANSNVILKVYDILGKEVATLVNKFQNAGSYTVIFDGQRTNDHSQLASGIYIYSLRTSKFHDSKKMILMK